MNELKTSRTASLIIPIFRRAAFKFSLALILVNIPSAFVCGDIVNSAAIARLGTESSEVIDSQSNVFFDLFASTSGSDEGTVLTSEVDATFDSEDIFQVNVTNTWDSRNLAAPATLGFGRNFDYEFRAEGNSISVTANDLVEQALFAGASTVGLHSFRWRIFDLTSANGFQAIEFDTVGTKSLSIIDGHDYLLRLTDTSNVSGISTNLGIFHSASFDVSVPARFTAVPEPGTTAVLTLAGICILGRRRRRDRFAGQTINSH